MSLADDAAEINRQMKSLGLKDDYPATTGAILTRLREAIASAAYVLGAERHQKIREMLDELSDRIAR